MKSAIKYTTFLFLLIIRGVNAFFEDLFQPIIDVLFSTACIAAQDALGMDDDPVSCTCIGKLGFFTISGTIRCNLEEEICLNRVNDSFCGQTNFGTEVQAGFLGFGPAGFSADLFGCFNFEDIDSKPKLCLSAVPSGLGLKSCKITIDDEECKKCKICPGGASFSYDCSGKKFKKRDDITGILNEIEGPKSGDDCVDLTFVRDVAAQN